ncbi:Methyltransferase type 11 [Desulfosarcina cetonica]|nr:Methyltransferase type 11 [Desulfosarcina cetonica]
MNGNATFQWDAQDYANHSSVQQTWARDLIAGLGLNGDETVLDIGCGDGKVTAEIAACLPKGSVTGIDSSAEMIALAGKTFPPACRPNLSFRVVDACRLPFQAQFDLVFSNAALHWIRDHQPVLEGIHRALKPSGRAVAQMGGRGNASQVIAAVETIMAQNEWQCCFDDFAFPYGFYAPEEYEPWLVAMGFVVVRLELIPKDMIHDTEKAFKGWFRTTWLPYLARVPEDAREHFIEAVTAVYCKAHPADPAGQIHTQMQRLEFEVIKPA